MSVGSTSSLRLGGLMSGMDTETIVNKMLEPEQTKIDNIKKKKQILEWQQESYREINTKLAAVKNSLIDLKLSATFNGKQVTSTDEKTLTATAKSDAIPGTYNIVVRQAAQRVSMSSTAALGSTGDKSSIAAQFGLDEDAQIKFTLKGKNGEIAFDFKAGDATIEDIVSGINDEETGMYAYYDEGVDRFFLMTEDFGTAAEITVKVDGINGEDSFLKDCLKLNISDSTGAMTSSKALAETAPDDSALLSSLYFTNETVPSTVTFTLEGDAGSADFSFATATTSLADLVNGINAKTAQTGITASYDEGTGKISLSSGGLLTIRADDEEFLGSKLNLSIDENKGTSCIVDFNDATNLEFDSNEFTLNSINFKVDPQAKPDTAVTLTVKNDVDTAVTKIKAFVEAYNAAVTLMSTKLGESRIYEDHEVKYQPLTDAQKEEMDEDQIEKWETYAKLGLMRNESILRSAMSDIRSVTTDMIKDKVADSNVSDREQLVDYYNNNGEKVSLDYLSLESIGITTAEWSEGSTDNAKLYINEEKLRQALEANPEDVQKLFTLTQKNVYDTKTVTNSDGTTSTYVATYNIGVAVKLYETLDNYISKVKDKAGTSSGSYDGSLIGKQLAKYDEQISDLEDRMDDLEDRYWNQFSAMEEALAKLSEQTSSIASLLNQTSNSSSS